MFFFKVTEQKPNPIPLLVKEMDLSLYYSSQVRAKWSYKPLKTCLQFWY